MRALARLIASGWCAALVLLVACSAGASQPSAPAAPAAPAPAAPAVQAAETTSAPAAPRTPDPVRLGVIGSASDAGFYLGLDLGYFGEQGLDVQTVPFGAGGEMVGPLGTGQLDVGGGNHSAGLFNAAARGIGIKLVADKGSLRPGHGYQALVFRRDLVESGQLRNPGDLRGLKMATSGRGGGGDRTMAAWLNAYGLTLDDVDWVELPFAQHAAAFAGHAVEAVTSVEPFVTQLVDRDLGTIYQRADEVIPNFQVAAVFYGDQFAQGQADVARRFMLAYIKALRYYNDAFDHGDQAKRREVVAILARNTPVKDEALYERMVVPGLDPDGRVNVDSLVQDQELWISIGLQQTRANINELVDQSFADAAVQALGPYRP
ncbi:MAG TPA: ABC transporter substrate-binding protein [Chloroflexota bacterium]|jgi:NitT/TauT family transport system substrate-binding protein